MAGIELRPIAVDIGRHNTIQVAPADDKAERYAALVDALDIVRGPDDGVCNARVYAERTKVDASVLDGVVLTAQLHYEADDADQADSDIAQASLLSFVRQPADEDCEDCRSCVWRDAEEVRDIASVSEVLDDCGCEEGERIQRTVAAYILSANKQLSDRGDIPM